jgi:hypothetical protein
MNLTGSKGSLETLAIVEGRRRKENRFASPVRGDC